MLNGLIDNVQEFMSLPWERIEPHFQELAARPIDEGNVTDWLNDWSRLAKLIDESESRLSVATTLDTTDEAAEARYLDYQENVIPHYREAAQRLKEKLLASGIEPAGYAITLRNMRAEVDLFREANLPLFTEESRLETEYDKIIGAQTVQWDGEERTIAQMQPLYQEPDRAVREQAWHATMERIQADRDALNNLWGRFLTLRRQIAANADLPDYRAFKWREHQRFDYTPDDALSFHAAIEEVVVPAAARIYEKRRVRLGLETLRPWDLDVDVMGRAPLRPFQQVDALVETGSTIFQKVDPTLGEYFDIMRHDALLDLDNRKGKAPGGYCTYYPIAKRPFIFMNAVGLHDDVQTLLHEGGHAFHAFAASHLPEYQTEQPSIEFCEVASMAMELLAAPYLVQDAGGFYSAEDAARARVEHLESMIRFWPYMAVVDAFQHWVYTYPEAAMNADECDREWARQWDRFMIGIDYSGLESIKETGWHRKLHIFQIPFYYIEYGLAQLGAVQVWRNALRDQAGAVEAYRRALALGGTASLPDLFAAAGAKFALDAATLREAVDLIEHTIEALDPA